MSANVKLIESVIHSWPVESSTLVIKVEFDDAATLGFARQVRDAALKAIKEIPS